VSHIRSCKDRVGGNVGHDSDGSLRASVERAVVASSGHAVQESRELPVMVRGLDLTKLLSKASAIMQFSFVG